MILEVDVEPAKMMRAKDAAVAAYVRLAIKAVEARCGGVFACASTWTDREWLVYGGVTREEGADAIEAGLARWSNDGSLVLSGIEAPRQRAARKGAEARWSTAPAHPERIPDASAPHHERIEDASESHLNRIGSASAPQGEGGRGGCGIPDLDSGSGPDSGSESGPLLSPQARVRSMEYSQEFLDFWELYPRRTGKGQAWRAWAKARRDSGPELLGHIGGALLWQRRCSQWTKDGGDFIPHPATYLNQRRWEDEPEAAPGAPVVDQQTNGVIGRFLERGVR